MTPSAPEALCAAYETRAALARGKLGRKQAGLFYTPPAIAARVVQLALQHGPRLPARPTVVDACAGAGIFLLAAARAIPGARLGGADLDPEALAVAAEALLLLGGEQPGDRARPRRGRTSAAAVLERLDALREVPALCPADLVVGNPPYGKAAAGERTALGALFPALRGGEIDLYAAFLLRSLELVRPGGCVALLVPDSWMTNARAAPLRAEVLARASLCAVADLGKPFAAAKDTRVQAVVLARRTEEMRQRGPRRERVARPIFAARLEGEALLPLAPILEAELRARAGAGWQPYRTPGEKQLCAAMEAASLPLAAVCTVGYGLRTGDNPRHVGAGAPAGSIALCGGADVVPFALRWRKKHLAAPTPGQLRLCERQREPRVALQRIRTNAQVPWARWLEAAPVPPGVVCLDSLSTLASPDAGLLWALLGLCGSVAWNRWHRLRTTDVNVKPAALRELPAPRALLVPAVRATLEALSRQRSRELAVELASPPSPRPRPRAPRLDQLAPAERALDRAPATERAIDRAVYDLFGLAPAAVEEAERGFWGPRFGAEFPRLPPAGRADEALAQEATAGPMSDPFDKVTATWEG